MSSELDFIKEDEDTDEPTAPFWMTTYADMITLLLVFFVLIVSMSNIEVQRFREALSYFHGRTGILDNQAVVSPEQIVTPFRTRNQAQRFESFLSYLQESGLEENVHVNLTSQGMHVVITDSVMFRSGEAVLLPPARMILSRMTALLEGVETVVVEGHTDTVPISTAQFPSNWELSATRASSVVRFLLQEGALPPERYTVVGYGEQRPRATNTTADGRALNRRIELLFSWRSWQNEPPYFPRTMMTPLER